jgi:hypothetical protein
VDIKPEEINLYANKPHSHTSQPSGPSMGALNQLLPMANFPYGCYPPPYMLWLYSQLPPTTILNQVPAVAPKLLPVQYPLITQWLKYCDSHLTRCSEDLGDHADKFSKEGYRRINQLTGDCISVEKLSDWLGIDKGTADLLIQYAEEDVELVKAGTFTMDG